MDKRTVRTRKMLREALLSLMKEKPINDIQVTEITRLAGTDRTTFYKHYKKPEDIISEMEAEQIDRFRSLLNEKKKSGDALLRDILNSIDKAEKMYCTKKHGVLPESFKTGLVSTAKEHGMQAWKDKLSNVDDEEAEIAYEALLAGALQAALTTKGKANREKVIKTIMDMINSYVKAHS